MTLIRAARSDEYADFVRLFPVLGTGDPVSPFERWRDDIAPNTLFAERDGAVVAYVFGQTLTSTGYVRNLVVAPEARGLGLGRALMLAAAERFGSRGCDRWCLNVKVDNAVAIGLYRSLGMSDAYRSTALALPWRALATLPPSPAAEARPIDAADDDAVERTFALPAGQLGNARTRPGRLLLGLRHDARWVGAACYSPSTAGAFPFRVADLRWVRASAEALRPHALSTEDDLHLVIDDGDAVTEALMAVGARMEMQLLHLEGAIPTPQRESNF